MTAHAPLPRPEFAFTHSAEARQAAATLTRSTTNALLSQARAALEGHLVTLGTTGADCKNRSELVARIQAYATLISEDSAAEVKAGLADPGYKRAAFFAAVARRAAEAEERYADAHASAGTAGALDWSNGGALLEAAAHAKVYNRVAQYADAVFGEHGDPERRGKPVTLAAVRAEVTVRLLSAASYGVSRSTSPVSNLLGEQELAALAAVVNLLDDSV